VEDYKDMYQIHNIQCYKKHYENEMHLNTFVVHKHLIAIHQNVKVLCINKLSQACI